jgi:hypothetical protein
VGNGHIDVYGNTFYDGKELYVRRIDMQTQRTVSAGITIISYRKQLTTTYKPDGTIDIEGLRDEWESNASQSIDTHYLQQSINPDEIPDSEFQRRVKESVATNPQSNLRSLLNKEADLSWSAPRQNLLDGVLYFYLSDSRARKNVRECLKEAQAKNLPAAQIEALVRDREYIYANARHLIGMARVRSKAYMGNGIGFNSRNFVSLDTANFHLLEHPLSYDFMKNHGQETYGSSVVSIPTDLQEVYRTELSKKNTLPDWYKNLRFGDPSIPFINRSNWLSVVPQLDNFELTQEDTSSPEFKVCYYFIRHLVDALKDEQADAHEQVISMRGTQATGRPDYMLRIENTWVPLEAKVSVNTEPNIRGQVSQYINLSGFKFRNGSRMTTISVKSHGVCLVADQYGVYLTKDGKFVDCTATEPRWPRSTLTRSVIRNIRAAVKNLLD